MYECSLTRNQLSSEYVSLSPRMYLFYNAFAFVFVVNSTEKLALNPLKSN